MLSHALEHWLKCCLLDSEAASQRCFYVKDVLKICSKFTGEYPFRSVISTKMLCNFIEITVRHGCSPVNLLHIFRTSFRKYTPEPLLLWIVIAFFTKTFLPFLWKYYKFFQVKGWSRTYKYLICSNLVAQETPSFCVTNQELVFLI